MKLVVVFLLLINAVYSFSQEKVNIKGVYEILNDKKYYELSKSDTIRFERMSLRDAIRDKEGINKQATVANRLRRLPTYKERYETLFRMSKFI